MKGWQGGLYHDEIIPPCLLLCILKQISKVLYKVYFYLQALLGRSIQLVFVRVRVRVRVSVCILIDQPPQNSMTSPGLCD
jgi:hypothetical protein